MTIRNVESEADLTTDVGRQKPSYKDFGGTAPENYERYFVPVIPAPLAADLVETARILPGEHVLDVGCGTGVVSRLAAQVAGRTGRVVGTDPTPGMLAVAGSLPASPGTSIEWRQAPAESLPLPDESFDLVLCQLALMFVADRPAALREMRRVLSTGGRLAINVPGRMTRLFEIMDEALARHVSPELAQFVRSVFCLHDPAEIETLLADAGFHDINVEVTTKTLRLPPPADFLWQYVHATPMGAVVAGCEDDRWEKVEHDVVAQWQQFVEDGHLVLQQPIVVATATA